MKIMPFAGTLVRFTRTLDDETLQLIDGDERVGVVTSRNRAMSTMRVCTSPGVYYTVALADAN